MIRVISRITGKGIGTFENIEELRVWKYDVNYKLKQFGHPELCLKDGDLFGYPISVKHPDPHYYAATYMREMEKMNV